MRILITGCAGFIGYHTSMHYLKDKNNLVIGVDSLNSYYSKQLKIDRLSIIKEKYPLKFTFHKLNICTFKSISNIFKNNKFDLVINLAAQAGVRYSLINPKAYVNSNINGFYNILELCKLYKVGHLVFASSSSVYGDSKKFPLKESDFAGTPLQLYAATKRSNELFAHSYSNLFRIKITALRFFTVYGPWGRPDMSLFKFVRCILKNKPIEIYNKGMHVRDFTYIDDLVNGIQIASNVKNFNKKEIPFRIFNIGSDKPIKLMKFIKIIEKYLNKESKKTYLEMQKGDIYKTHSDINKLQKLGYYPKTSIDKGVKKFIKWYQEYYKL